MPTTRRQFLLSLAGRQAGPPGTLVTVFLRGGADGLSLVAPYGEDAYYRARPTLALARPGDRRGGDRLTDLDGFFGLHPALAPLAPLYQNGQMAVVHACGSGDQTRSHFEAMATVERGLAQNIGAAGGWLARHLESAPWSNPSPLRAVALGEMLPETLQGTGQATALRSAADVRLAVPNAGRTAAVEASLRRLYSRGDRLDGAGQEALSALERLGGLSPAQMRPANGAVYPNDEFGDALRQTACLMRAGVGLEAACLDQGSYDTHVGQGALLTRLLQSLAGGLAAFAQDLGPDRWRSTTVVVLSEFGRRVAENDGLGTDHGRAGAMFVLGGSGVAGGRIHGVWPGLSGDHLEGPGDLRVTTDYRRVLAEILTRRLGNPHIAAVFPGLTPQPVGVIHA